MKIVGQKPKTLCLCCVKISKNKNKNSICSEMPKIAMFSKNATWSFRVKKLNCRSWKRKKEKKSLHFHS